MAQNDIRYMLNGGFFNGSWTGEGEAPAISYDRVYDSEDMVQPYRNVVTDGIFAYETADGTEDATLEVGFACAVKSGENAVTLQPGSGLINHHWFELDHIETVEISQNSSLTPRVDSLIIQCNMGMSDRAMYLIYRQGTASAPALEGDGTTIFEFRLWNITVPSNQIGGAISLEDRRGMDECPYITGLLQQLSLQDRLDHFDQQAQDKIDSFDDMFDEKVGEYDTQFATKISQYDSQFAQKLQGYDNSMSEIWAEWESLKAQIGQGGGGGISTNLTITRGYLTYESGTITIDGYNPNTDTVFLFINGLYANTTNDYDLSTAGVITFKNTINSGAGIDWWKFTVTQSGGGDTPPTQGFTLTVGQYDGTTLQPEEDGSYDLDDGVSYFITAPSFSGTYKWEMLDGQSWNIMVGQTGASVTVTGGQHDGIRCTVTYNETDYISTALSFGIAITGTVETPVIKITEADGYVHQTQSTQNKVATPSITIH